MKFGSEREAKDKAIFMEWTVGGKILFFKYILQENGEGLFVGIETYKHYIFYVVLKFIY